MLKIEFKNGFITCAFIRHFHKRKSWFRKFGFAIGTCSLSKDGFISYFLSHAIPHYTTLYHSGGMAGLFLFFKFSFIYFS